jgi:hypothetical protein
MQIVFVGVEQSLREPAVLIGVESMVEVKRRTGWCGEW